MKFMPHFKFDIIGFGLSENKWKQQPWSENYCPKVCKSFWIILVKICGVLCLFKGRDFQVFLRLFFLLLLPSTLCALVFITERGSYLRTLTLAQFFLKFSLFCLLVALKCVVYAVLDAARLTIDPGCLEYTWMLTWEGGHTQWWEELLKHHLYISIWLVSRKKSQFGLINAGNKFSYILTI